MRCIRRLARRLRGGDRRKRREELAYWRARRIAEGELDNAHFEAEFTGMVGLDRGFYADKDVLDVGCGPRGSLVWADELARRRVGLDPLAAEYLALGADRHAMEYVAAPAEAMPFAGASFDVVTSLNALDHVDNLDGAVAEIKRVLRPGGHLLIAVEVGHEPTWTEPQALDWDVWRAFEPELEPVEVGEYERGAGDLYEGVFRRELFDRAEPTPRPGVLVAIMRKR